MTSNRKRVLSILLGLIMALGLMSMTVFASNDSPYTSIMENTAKVYFNGRSWIIIADNSITDGTVTLWAADTSFGSSVFSSGGSNDYNNSKIKNDLDALTATGEFRDVADAIKDTAYGKLYLLSVNEAGSLYNDQNDLSFNEADFSGYWLRDRGKQDDRAAYVQCSDTPVINDDGVEISRVIGVRPALRLDLSKVTYDSTRKTFWLRSAAPSPEPVSYMAWDSTARKLVGKTCTEYTLIEDIRDIPVSGSGLTRTLSDGWYVLGEDIFIPDTDRRIYISGTVNIIIKDGKTLTASKGIGAADDHTLNIYGQAAGTGTLIATTTDSGYSGIGGGYNSKGGTVSIYGGTVTAAGGEHGAGIGGGNGRGGTVSIYGGTVIATGGNDGAGIGGGYDDGGTVSIYGGTVTATGNGSGFGIGKGVYYYSFTQGSLTVADPLIVYGGDSENPTTVVSKVNNDYARCKYMIIFPKATPNVTAPTARTLTYTGSEQALVNAGSATGGTMQYAFGTDAATTPTTGWGTSVPTATNAGTYYVWYKVVGDKNHNDTEPACVTTGGKSIVITPAKIKITAGDKVGPEPADISGLGYTISGNISAADEEALEIRLYLGDPAGKDPKVYPIKVSYKPNANLDITAVDGKYTATKGSDDSGDPAGPDDPVNPDEPISFTVYGYVGEYDGYAHGIIFEREGSLDSHEVIFADEEFSSWDEVKKYDEEQGHPAYAYTDAGEYVLYYYALDGDVFISGSKEVIITRAAPGVTAPEACRLKHSGKAQKLVRAGEAEGGEMQYALGSDGVTVPAEGWDTSVPTAADIGTYYVWYKVVGDKNHNDTEPACVAATISDSSSDGDSDDSRERSVKTVTVNVKTVNAKAVEKAVAKAGGSSKYVTTIVLGKKVRKISKGAFKNYKNAKTLVVKTKKLKKAKVKKSLKGSKITKVKVKVSSKKGINKKYVKKYKKIFTKKIAGRKVKVSL